MPAAVGSPRNHSAEPVNAGRAVIIGIDDDRSWLAVMTRPCEVSGSALMTSMETLAPARTMIFGLTRPAMRNVSSGPPAGPARATSLTVRVAKVTVPMARLMTAPAGTWLPRLAASPGLTRGPGAAAHSLPMNWPGSALVPIIENGQRAPRIQAGALVPPNIH